MSIANSKTSYYALTILAVIMIFHALMGKLGGNFDKWSNLLIAAAIISNISSLLFSLKDIICPSDKANNFKNKFTDCNLLNQFTHNLLSPQAPQGASKQRLLFRNVIELSSIMGSNYLVRTFNLLLTGREWENTTIFGLIMPICQFCLGMDQ